MSADVNAEASASILTKRQAQGAKDLELSEVSDNYGRLKLWGVESRALRTGRGSLDDSLRNNEKLRSVLLDLLNDLKEAIGLPTLSARRDDAVNPGAISPAGNYDQDSSSGTGSATEYSGNETSKLRPKTTKIQRLITIIFGYIASLYRLSRSLRRTTVHEKYIRSVSKGSDESPFAPLDQAHIGNKFPLACHVLVRRLGLANTRRRQQLKYRDEHPPLPGQDTWSLANAGPSRFNSQGTGLSDLTTDGSESGNVSALSLGTPSKASHQSLTTVARSVLRDDASLSGERNTVYATSQSVGGSTGLRIPDVPTVADGQTTFKCPYCHAELETVNMKERGLWKHEWLYHEKQLHQRTWICRNGCDQKFKSSQLLKDHIIHDHPGTFSESQLPILVNMCERAADPDERESCSMCGQEMNIVALRVHVASHLEDIALFVLPRGTDEDKTDADSNYASSSLQQVNDFDNDDHASIPLTAESSAAKATDNGGKAASSGNIGSGLVGSADSRVGPPERDRPVAGQGIRGIDNGEAGHDQDIPQHQAPTTTANSPYALAALTTAFVGATAITSQATSGRLFRGSAKEGPVPPESDATTVKRPLTSSKHIPSDLSCLVLYEPLAPNYHKQAIRINDDGNKFWAPPNRKNAYHRDKAAARLFRWKGRKMTDITAGNFNKEYSPYGVATVFTQYSDTEHLLAVTFDAGKKDVAEEYGGWKILSFDRIPLDGAKQPYLSSVGVAGPKKGLAAPGSPAWMPQLLPKIYDYDSQPGSNEPQPVSAGLIDEEQRGMVVTVFLDPENKKGSTEPLLDALQNGHYGPFYGPQIPNPAAIGGRIALPGAAQTRSPLYSKPLVKSLFPKQVLFKGGRPFLFEAANLDHPEHPKHL
ncbi:MAG: hypothetical protein Q9169_006441 [Polycauliona sp. 2 TL-2023]